MMSVYASKTVVHMFISWCLDYCNSLLHTAFPTSCYGTYRPFRMLQHAWSLAPEGVTT